MDQHRRIAFAQGIFFVGTGVWPLVHMSSFEAVTGPKADKWLVRTVGVLVSVVGGVLISAAARHRVTGEIAGLAIGTAAGLGVVEAVYAARGRIDPVYLTDAAVESELVAAWMMAGRPHAAARRTLPPEL